MEFMNLEITRLNNKVNKLKQYKAIVNKLTGNEFEIQGETNQIKQPEPQVQQHGQKQYNDTLFLY